MSGKVQGLAWESTISDRVQVSVLVYLGNCSDDFGGNCFPGIALIAKRTRYSARAVIRAIGELESEGWISVKRGDGKGNFSQYQIDVEKLKECQDVTLSKPRKPRAKPKECQGGTLFDAAQRVNSGHQRVKSTTAKGEIHDNPPHPLLGVNVTETSLETTTPLTPHRKRRGELSAEIPDAVQTKARATDVAPHSLPGRKSERPLAFHRDAASVARDPAAEGRADPAAGPARAAEGGAGAGGLSSGFEPDEFTPGQREHLARCKPADLPRWERHYREENASISAAGRRAIADVEKARRLFPTRQAAIERVMQACGFVAGTRRNPLPAILGQVFERCAQLGAEPWTTGPMLIAAWEAQRGDGGKFHWGALKFFRDGHWRDYVPTGKAVA